MPATYTYVDAGTAILSWYQAYKGLLQTQRLMADGKDGPGAAEENLLNVTGTWTDMIVILENIYINGVLP